LGAKGVFPSPAGVFEVTNRPTGHGASTRRRGQPVLKHDDAERNRSKRSKQRFCRAERRTKGPLVGARSSEARRTSRKPIRPYGGASIISCSTAWIRRPDWGVTLLLGAQVVMPPSTPGFRAGEALPAGLGSPASRQARTPDATRRSAPCLLVQAIPSASAPGSRPRARGLPCAC
jgi:hypothetical protein